MNAPTRMGTYKRGDFLPARQCARGTDTASSHFQKPRGGPGLVRPDLTPGVPDELIDAKAMAVFLGIRRKEVYDLPIPTVRLSPRRLRWWRSDVLRYVNERTSHV
jgi:predicted DNA-binding transcriptional regulator AlpA